MRWVIARAIPVLLIMAGCALITGCDPGFTVRQVTPKYQAMHEAPLVERDLQVEVKVFHILAYSRYYAPQLVISNNSSSMVSVTKVEILTAAGSSANETELAIEPGSAHTALVHFELPQPLAVMFKKGGDLRVDYVMDGRKRSVTTKLSGKMEGGIGKN